MRAQQHGRLSSPITRTQCDIVCVCFGCVRYECSYYLQVRTVRVRECLRDSLVCAGVLPTTAV